MSTGIAIGVDVGGSAIKAGAVDAATGRLVGSAIIKDEKRCTRCGLCAKRCPTHAITMELFEEREVPA